jgi:transposase-like protein
MDFPIIDLLDNEASVAWIEKHFHPQGLKCVHCQASLQEARFFRVNRGSGLPVYRCLRCAGIYHLYSGTLFAESQLSPEQVVLLLQGVLQGKSSRQLGRELGLTEKTAHKWRQRIQQRAEQIQPNSPLNDLASESDEMFQNAGEKRSRTL